MPVHQLTFAEVSDEHPFRADVTHYRSLLADTLGPERVRHMSDHQVLDAARLQRSEITFAPSSRR